MKQQSSENGNARISPVSNSLLHPLTVSLVDYSRDVNAPRFQVDGKQHEVS